MLIRWKKFPSILIVYFIINHNIIKVGSDDLRKSSQPNLTTSTTPDPGGGDSTAHSTKTDSTDSKLITTVELYIKKKESRDGYTYEKSGETGIFTAKEGYGFDKVGIVPWCYTYDSCDRCILEVVWEASDSNQYAIKVTRDGVGYFKCLKNVEIKFNNGDVKKFQKGFCGWCSCSCLGSWSEVNSGEEYVPVS